MDAIKPNCADHVRLARLLMDIRREHKRCKTEDEIISEHEKLYGHVVLRIDNEPPDNFSEFRVAYAPGIHANIVEFNKLEPAGFDPRVLAQARAVAMGTYYLLRERHHLFFAVHGKHLEFFEGSFVWDRHIEWMGENLVGLHAKLPINAPLHAGVPARWKRLELFEVVAMHPHAQLPSLARAISRMPPLKFLGVWLVGDYAPHHRKLVNILRTAKPRHFTLTVYRASNIQSIAQLVKYAKDFTDLGVSVSIHNIDIPIDEAELAAELAKKNVTIVPTACALARFARCF